MVRAWFCLLLIGGLFIYTYNIFYFRNAEKVTTVLDEYDDEIQALLGSDTNTLEGCSTFHLTSTFCKKKILL